MKFDNLSFDFKTVILIIKENNSFYTLKDFLNVYDEEDKT